MIKGIITAAAKTLPPTGLVPSATEDDVKGPTNTGQGLPVAPNSEGIASARLALSSTSLTPGQLIPIHDDSLLPGYSAKPFDFNTIKSDQIVLVNLRDNSPSDDKLVTAYEAKCGYRYSTHWNWNGPVGSHEGGSWGGKSCAVLIPYDNACELNGKPAGGNEVDTFWSKTFNGKTEEAILLVKKDSVPAGMIQLLTPQEAGLDPNTKMKIFGVSDDINETIPHMVRKMGRTAMNGGTLTLDPDFNLNNPISILTVSDETIAKRNGVKKFLREEGVQECLHSYSPFMQVEASLTVLGNFLTGESWTKNGTDFQKVILQNLNSALEEINAQPDLKQHFPLDVEKFRQIIEESKTPEDAQKRLTSGLGEFKLFTFKLFIFDLANKHEAVLKTEPKLLSAIQQYSNCDQLQRADISALLEPLADAIFSQNTTSFFGLSPEQIRHLSLGNFVLDALRQQGVDIQNDTIFETLHVPETIKDEVSRRFSLDPNKYFSPEFFDAASVLKNTFSTLQEEHSSTN